MRVFDQFIGQFQHPLRGAVSTELDQKGFHVRDGTDLPGAAYSAAFHPPCPVASPFTTQPIVPGVLGPNFHADRFGIRELESAGQSTRPKGVTRAGPKLRACTGSW
jgi:hypothetical protein